MPLAAADIARLRAQYGLALTVYVPNLAYVERVPPEPLARLQQDPLVRAIIAYLPEYKIEPSVATLPPNQPATLEAYLFDRGSLDLVQAAVTQLGGQDVVAFDNRPHGGFPGVRFTLAGGVSVEPLADLDDVRWIGPVPIQKDDDVAAMSQIESGDPANASIWSKGLHGEGQVIGMIDGGPIDINHCFFRDVAPNTPGPTHRKVIALRNVTNAAPAGHGTFVGGCAAGDDIGNPGTHANRGGAFAAKSISGHRGDMNALNTLLAELNAARLSGAFIHTNSWHDQTTPAHAQPALYTQNAADVDNFTFVNEDMLVLGSAGNSTPTIEELGPPGTAKNAICVTAAQAGANAMNLGDGNPGPTADGRMKPDLAAVGCAVTSAMVGTPCGVGQRSPCASSYSTPHAAAAAALVRQYLTEGWYPTGKKVAANAMVPTGALLKAILLNATVPMTGVAGYPNNTTGWGLIRLDRTLYFDGALRRLALWDVRHAVGPTNSARQTHTVEVVDNTEDLKITMAFSDAPAGLASFATPAVNDLDLKVTAPDGTTYLGNAFTNGVSTPNGGAAVGDSLNTVETVYLHNPAKGKWTIEVIGFRVAVGGPGQGYGLVASATTKKSLCFVAGAVYGDPDHPDVAALRAWRDRTLLPGARGRRLMAAFVRMYEQVGPPAARLVGGRPRVCAILRRFALHPLARAVSRWH